MCIYRIDGDTTGTPESGIFHIMFAFRIFHGTRDVKSPACKCLNIYVCNESSVNE